MYLVKVWGRDNVPYTLHDPRDETLLLTDPVFDGGLNRTGVFSFEIAPDHPNLPRIEQMVSEIGIYRDGAALPFYVGRPLNSAADMDNVSSITCEGVLAYLLDSIVRPYEYTGSITGFLTQLLNSHNSQVEERKRFKLGNVTVVDSNNYINRSNSDYSTTMDAIQDKLINTHGGYIRVRFEADGRYLDYLTDYGHVNSQVIEFAENLLDLERLINPDTLITGVIPIGAETDEEGINGTMKRVDITSVNNGKDYLVDETAAAHFGYIFRPVYFDDVTLPANLKWKGQAYLEENCNLVTSLNLTAVDLHNIDVEIEEISVGDWIRVLSRPHGLDKLFLVTAQTIHLTAPEKDTVALGKTLKTMTGSSTKAQAELTAYVIETAKGEYEAMIRAVENATELVTGGKGGYVVIDRAEDGHPQGILIMDHPSTEDAMNVIQINKNGIGFSTSGIKGPYTNAWTIDGALNASFITTGSLSANRISSGYMSANRIWAGVLQSVNGASKINLNTGEAELSGHFKVTNPDTQTEVGGIKWDTNGAGTESDAKNRMYLYTEDGYALKISSGYRMSLASDTLIYLSTPSGRVTINAGGTQWHFRSDGIYCGETRVVEKP